MRCDAATVILERAGFDAAFSRPQILLAKGSHSHGIAGFRTVVSRITATIDGAQLRTRLLPRFIRGQASDAPKREPTGDAMCISVLDHPRRGSRGLQTQAKAGQVIIPVNRILAAVGGSQRVYGAFRE